MIFILGGGPTLFQVPYERTQGHRCIAVNNSYLIAPWAELVWFGDLKWWTWHRDNLKTQDMPVFSCCPNLQTRGNGDVSFVTVYERENRKGITTRPGMVMWNGSSGASAINLAYHLGAKRIILLGFDMRRVDGRKNWHNDHKESPNTNPFRRHLKCFSLIKRDAEPLGLEILNASPGSAIQDFPFVDLEELV